MGDVPAHLAVPGWEFATYCGRCDQRFDKAEEKIFCGDTAESHQWRTDHFRGLLDLIAEAGMVAYVHDTECAIWKRMGACDKKCGERAHAAARAEKVTMSLDIYLGRHIDYGGPEGPIWHEVYEANITHNLVGMWRLAGVYDVLYESHDQRASDILPTLERGIEFMATHPDECRNLNSPNGWGTYAAARPWLVQLAEACRRYPLATIRVSR